MGIIDVIKRNGCHVVRDQPLNARVNRGQHLADVGIGQYGFAEFKNERLFGTLAVCEVAGDFGKSD